MSIEVHKCPECGHHFFWPVRHLADGSHRAVE